MKVTRKQLEEYFNVDRTRDNLYKLNLNNYTKPIYIKFPFILDEDVASLAGLMPDGSLIKDMMRIYFHQKKDLTKISLFSGLLVKLFSSEINLFIRVDTRGRGMQCYVNSKTLAWFFYYILNVPKSDEQMRVPKWIFGSSENIKFAYLRQAFDMEGTILKKLTEIRFVSKDELFAKDIKNLLESIGICCYLTYAPRYRQPSGQYRVSIYRKENFIKFKQIGFQIPSLKNRFNCLLDKYNILEKNI